MAGAGAEALGGAMYDFVRFSTARLPREWAATEGPVAAVAVAVEMVEKALTTVPAAAVNPMEKMARHMKM